MERGGERAIADRPIEHRADRVFGNGDLVAVHVADDAAARQMLEIDPLGARARALQQAQFRRRRIAGAIDAGDHHLGVGEAFPLVLRRRLIEYRHHLPVRGQMPGDPAGFRGRKAAVEHELHQPDLGTLSANRHAVATGVGGGRRGLDHDGSAGIRLVGQMRPEPHRDEYQHRNQRRPHDLAVGAFVGAYERRSHDTPPVAEPDSRIAGLLSLVPICTGAIKVPVTEVTVSPKFPTG